MTAEVFGTSVWWAHKAIVLLLMLGIFFLANVAAHLIVGALPKKRGGRRG